MSHSIKFTVIGLICTIIFGTLILHLSLRIGLNTQHPFGVVWSGSMEPAIRKGDLVIIRGVDAVYIRDGNGNNNTGDVIAFNAQGLWNEAPDEPIVHRVINKWKEGGLWYFQTKGDANYYMDKAPIPENRVLGVVCAKVPFIGFLLIFFVDLRYFGILVICMLIILVSIVVTNRKKKFNWKYYQ